jgi:hypothetical protein
LQRPGCGIMRNTALRHRYSERARVVKTFGVRSPVNQQLSASLALESAKFG